MKLRKEESYESKLEKITMDLEKTLDDLENYNEALKVLTKTIDEKNQRRIAQAHKSLQELSKPIGEGDERERNE